VLSGIDVDTALQRIGVAHDFDYRKSQADSNIMFLHRHLEDGEIYFLTNQRPHAEVTEATFRVDGKIPEIWRAETGSVEPASYRTEGGRTIVTLKLAPYEAYFVAFRKNATATAVTVPSISSTTLSKLDAGWSLTFQAGRGAPTIPLTTNVGSGTSSCAGAPRAGSSWAARPVSPNGVLARIRSRSH